MSLFSKRPCLSCAEKDRALELLKEAWREAALSKEADLTYLREQNTALTKKLTEMQSPGVTHRTEPAKRVPTPTVTYPVVNLPPPLPGHDS